VAVPLIKEAVTNGEIASGLIALEYTCAQHDIDHRIARARHPWTNGRVERMSRTIKGTTL